MMLLLIITIFQVLMFTSYTYWYLCVNKKGLSHSTGKIISMVFAMLSSLTLGTVVGIFFKHNLTITTILACSLSVFLGFVTGRPISSMAMMEGMLSGLMGGMMGGMLGVMLPSQNYDLMLVFLDLIFIFFVFILFKLINNEISVDNKKRFNRLNHIILTLCSILILVAILVVQLKNNIVNASDNLHSKQQAYSEKIRGKQVGRIDVSLSGYSPKNIELVAGIPTTINFKKEDNDDCLRVLISPSLGIKTNLNKGDNYINLEDPKLGVYKYMCGENMYEGLITFK